MRTRYILSLSSAITLSLSAAAFAAGGHDGGHHGGSPAGEQGKAADVTRTISVAMKDNYYEPESIQVKEGETVRFTVKNEGTLVHEFNIGTPSMHESHQDEMMMMVQHGVIGGGHIDHDKMNMDMGNGHTMKHDDPNSVLLEPGDSREIVWKFSERANLEFACNVPGHYQAGMAGVIEFNNSDLAFSENDNKRSEVK